jgi:hypothetical protein
LVKLKLWGKIMSEHLTIPVFKNAIENTICTNDAYLDKYQKKPQTVTMEIKYYFNIVSKEKSPIIAHLHCCFFEVEHTQVI